MLSSQDHVQHGLSGNVSLVHPGLAHSARPLLILHGTEQKNDCDIGLLVQPKPKQLSAPESQKFCHEEQMKKPKPADGWHLSSRCDLHGAGQRQAEVRIRSK